MSFGHVSSFLFASDLPRQLLEQHDRDAIKIIVLYGQIERLKAEDREKDRLMELRRESQERLARQLYDVKQQLAKERDGRKEESKEAKAQPSTPAQTPEQQQPPASEPEHARETKKQEEKPAPWATEIRNLPPAHELAMALVGLAICAIAALYFENQLIQTQTELKFAQQHLSSSETACKGVWTRPALPDLLGWRHVSTWQLASAAFGLFKQCVQAAVGDSLDPLLREGCKALTSIVASWFLIVG